MSELQFKINRLARPNDPFQFKSRYPGANRSTTIFPVYTIFLFDQRIIILFWNEEIMLFSDDWSDYGVDWEAPCLFPRMDICASSRVSRRYLWLFCLVEAEMCTCVHTEAPGTTAEAISLGSVLPRVAHLAVNFSLMLGNVCAFQQLVTHSTLKAHLVPFLSCTNLLLSGVHWLLAFGALGMLNGLERHCGLVS